MNYLIIKQRISYMTDINMNNSANIVENDFHFYKQLNHVFLFAIFIDILFKFIYFTWFFFLFVLFHWNTLSSPFWKHHICFNCIIILTLVKWQWPLLYKGNVPLESHIFHNIWLCLFLILQIFPSNIVFVLPNTKQIR